MNWNMSKNIMLIMLIFLSISLKIIEKVVDSSYMLTEKQNVNISKVLNNNSIGLYSKIPKKYYPMKEIELQYNNIIEGDKGLIESIIGEDKKYKVTKKEGWIEYVHYAKVLKIEGNKFLYVDKYNRSLGNVKDERAVEIVDGIVKRLGERFIKYELDRDAKSGDERIIEYREKIDGVKIYDNYVKVRIKGDEIKSIEGVNFKVNGHVGEKREIVSADMALMTFINETKVDNAGLENEIFIDNIDLVYYKDTTDTNIKEDNIITNGVPVYRIYTGQVAKPFIINGYTNKLIQ